MKTQFIYSYYPILPPRSVLRKAHSTKVYENPTAAHNAATKVHKQASNREALGEMVQQASAFRPVCGAVRQHHSTQSTQNASKVHNNTSEVHKQASKVHNAD